VAGKTLLRREAPPPLVRGGFRAGAGRKPEWPGILAAVEAGRGAWFRAREYATRRTAGSMAVIVRKRYDPAGRFEFTARTVGGKGVVFARLKVEAGK
jgi:hypothetical protein